MYPLYIAEKQEEHRFSPSTVQNSSVNKNLVLNFVSRPAYRVLVKGRSCLITFSHLLIAPRFATVPCVISSFSSRWWAPWLSVRVFSHFRTVSRQSRDRVTCHRHHTTYPDLYWSFLIVCDDFRSFPIIFSDLRWFLPSGNVLCSLQLLDQHHATLRKLYGSVKQLPRTPACRYIKIARPHQRTTSARWCRDSAWSRDRGYMPNIDMLNVGVHVRFRSLVLSGKT
jgi:hypothetical protein